jgi:phenylpyruvate tautomerase PptA (4-oxalocrotonate tautomerase family)
MPQLLIRGISAEQVKSISQPLVEELADLCACGTDNFTLEVVNSTFVFDGKVVPGYPFIEVKWFERGLEVQDKFAYIITKQVHSLEIPEVEVAFSTFRESGYYLNGKSFAEKA